MRVQFFCPRWGSEYLRWEDFFGRARDEGYDGVEAGISREMERGEQDRIWNLAEQRGLLLLPQHYDTVDADPGRHFAAYCEWLERMEDYPAVKINSQTGRDIFGPETNKALMEVASQFSEVTGVAVVHETHRHKFSFAAHITKEYLEEMPELKITLDASHWVCVAESFLEDQAAAMELAIERTEHIHARVGYPEGPQVMDPRAPEWQTALQHHLRWWDAVVARCRKEGAASVTITPEFGPYPYLAELPYSRLPITDQWEVNAWMMRLLKERYK
ncbi:MAG TPA: hypothetical protein VNU72_07305 [Puia sp.]|nr:hypothetical protein [Puia sp.]